MKLIPMKEISVLLLSCGLAVGQLTYAAEGDCQPLASVEGDDLVALILNADADVLQQVDFDDGEVCTLTRESLDLDDANATSFHLSADLNELAVQASVDGYETWLRIDGEYGGELLLDRATGEGLDLTDAEFLGDNSQLEASDFFIEYVGSLEMGGLALRNVETNIPLLEVPYDHYADRGVKPEVSAPGAEFLTVGSIGEEILEELLITLDIANQRIYMTDAK